jgi:hypothetical protein
MGNQQIAAFLEMLGYAIRERLHHRSNSNFDIVATKAAEKYVNLTSASLIK